jgi:hypothetical protein
MDKTRNTELGPEKLCSKCNEYWPADKEFFYTNKKAKDGLYHWCKACYAEWWHNRYPTKYRIDPERNRGILECRDSGMTLAQIGDRFGMTRQRVQQICKRQIL